jgi:hypothetical protein
MIDVKFAKKDESPKSLFNPMKSDAVFSIRDDQNVPQIYIIHSMEIETYPTYLADIIIKKLITAIQNERGVLGTNLKGIEEIRKEVET